MPAKKSAKFDYFRLNEILKRKCLYNIVFGERSNGKTYAVLEYGIKRYARLGEQMAVLRRWREDFRGKRAEQLFDGLNKNGVVYKASDGKWEFIQYWRGKWYFARTDPDSSKVIRDTTPFAYAFALTEMEHDKGDSYDGVTTIFYDEFISRVGYLPDEFVMFQNTLSTIIRLRDNVTIFMCANTVNKYCPYFHEMGLKHIIKMEQGDIDVYNYGDSGLSVAVQYADSPKTKKASNKYFAFDNAKLQMITGGAWEIGTYPHITNDTKWTKANIAFSWFLDYDGQLLQADIVEVKNTIFTYVHRKTTPIQDEIKDVVFTFKPSIYYTHVKYINKSPFDFVKRIWQFFRTHKVFYQDNDCGELMRNYLLACGDTEYKFY